MSNEIDNVDSDFYYVNNEPYARVTTILKVISKPKLVMWMMSKGLEESRKISHERREFGTRFHGKVHEILDGKIPYVDENDSEMLELLGLFRDWNVSSVIPKYLELTVLNKDYAYAGTIDFIGEIDGKFTIADWKTSKTVYENHLLQLSAYKHAFECEYPNEPKLEQGKVICFRGKSVLERTVSADTLDRLFPVFLCAKKIFDWQKGHIQ